MRESHRGCGHENAVPIKRAGYMRADHFPSPRRACKGRRVHTCRKNTITPWLWLKHRRSAPPLARNHLGQATVASVAAGVLIACLSGAIVALGGWEWHWTWVVVLTYFVCIHGALVMMGMFALAKAMAGQAWRYPLVGPRDP